MIKGKKILITGGGGFIGTHLAERLSKKNKIILFDISFKRSPFSYSGLAECANVKTITGNVLDYGKLKRISKDINIVIHLAATVGVKRVIKSPRTTIEVNLTGTANALKALGNKKIERFVYFSTSEVFGTNAFRTAEDGEISFSSANDARWSYSISKIAGEQLVHSYYVEKKMPTVIIRPFNIFGPLRTGEHVMKIFIMQALKNKDITIFQDGSQIRAWCYIDDIVDAVVACLGRKQAVGKIFNIGNQLNTITIYDLAKKVIKLTDSKSKIKFINPEYTDIDIRVPETSRAGKILGFKPKYEIEEGIIKTVRWYRENLNRL